MNRKRFVAYIHFTGFDNVQLGFHINWSLPNAEVHLPFCFVRVGLAFRFPEDRERHIEQMKQRFPLSYRTFGVGARS